MNALTAGRLRRMCSITLVFFFISALTISISGAGAAARTIFGEYTDNVARVPVTRTQFCALSTELFDCIKGTEAVSEMSDYGGLCTLFGTDCATLGPGSFVTREEAAVLFVNMARLLECPPYDNPPEVANETAISDWAVGGVRHVLAEKLMTADADNMFDPKSYITVGQTLNALQALYIRAIVYEPRKISINDPLVKGKKIPILIYHAVSDKPWNTNDTLFVRLSEMEAHLNYIVENGYQAITFEDLDNIGAFDKPVMLTFDDGYRDNYDNLFPLLKQYNVKATIFMISNAVYDPTYLSVENIKEMADSGLVSIQSHTVNHLHLTSLKKDTLAYELGESKAFLENITGRPVIALCYPYGESGPTVRGAASEYYNYAVTTANGKFSCGTNAMTMSRIYIDRGTSVGTFAAKIR